MKMNLMTAAVLALVSLNAAAESCGSGACPTPSWPAGTLQGQQQQAQNNTTTQSPTMVLSGSNTVNNITSDLPAASGVTISSDGGFTFNGSCPTTQLFVAGTGGRNDMTSQPYGASSQGTNIGATVGVVIPDPFGESTDTCLENQKLSLQAGRISLARLLITSCMTFAKMGMSVEQMVQIEPEFGKCQGVIEDALKNYHGEQARQIAEAYRQQNIQAMQNVNFKK